MPLLDHFRPPLHPTHHWESFHSNWATRIADALNDGLLPPGFLAEEHTHAGSRLEIDVAAFERPAETAAGAGGTATAVAAPPRTYTPPAPAVTVPAVFPDSFEVRILTETGGATLVAAIELIGPADKDRPEQRRAFAAKCAGLLSQGVALAVIDIVTTRRANLHNEIVALLPAGGAARMPEDADLYSAAYRPVTRGDAAGIDVWTARLGLGSPLPTMPLRLTGDLFVPVDFESSYREACRRRRIS